jgi:hypothetical protein
MNQSALDSASTRGRVLVAGVVLTDRENTAAQSSAELARSNQWQVEQRWIAVGREPVPDALRRVTVEARDALAPKFVLLNRLLKSISLTEYAFVLICDDDILLPDGFLDAYLDCVRHYDFALCQPARTHDSYIDHRFVEQVDGLHARRTRFVEIGPLISIRHDLVGTILPFDESSPMGWGYDFAWPCLVEARGLKMGIIDALPVAHSVRMPVANYEYAVADEQMRQYLDTNPHLSESEAFVILESYPRP